MKTARKQKRCVGDIVKIDLGDGSHTYARVLSQPELGFYDIKTAENIPPDKIVSIPYIFKLWVMDYAIKDRIWPVVGNIPLSSDELIPEYYLHRDQISGRFSVYHDGEILRPAISNKDMSLEPAAVWYPNQVEDRIRAHFLGIPDKWSAEFWRRIP